MPGGGGLSINQAMLLGTPVICAEEVGTDTELVIDGLTGIKFKRGNVEEMSKKGEELLDDKSLVSEISNFAREHLLKTATINHMAEGFLKALSSCKITRVDSRGNL